MGKKNDHRLIVTKQCQKVPQGSKGLLIYGDSIGSNGFVLESRRSVHNNVLVVGNFIKKVLNVCLVAVLLSVGDLFASSGISGYIKLKETTLGG